MAKKRKKTTTFTSAKPHKRNGRLALNRRRKGALDRLLAVKKPNERQQQEIEVLKERTHT